MDSPWTPGYGPDAPCWIDKKGNPDHPEEIERVVSRARGQVFPCTPRPFRSGQEVRTSHPRRCPDRMAAGSRKFVRPPTSCGSRRARSPVLEVRPPRMSAGLTKIRRRCRPVVEFVRLAARIRRYSGWPARPENQHISGLPGPDPARIFSIASPRCWRTRSASMS